MTYDFNKIEILLTRLLKSVADVFSDGELMEVSEFIENGEYGLALETLVYIFSEERKLVPKEVFDLVRESAAAMDMDATSLVSKLDANE